MAKIFLCREGKTLICTVGSRMLTVEVLDMGRLACYLVTRAYRPNTKLGLALQKQIYARLGRSVY